MTCAECGEAITGRAEQRIADDADLCRSCARDGNQRVEAERDLALEHQREEREGR